MKRLLLALVVFCGMTASAGIDDLSRTAEVYAPNKCNECPLAAAFNGGPFRNYGAFTRADAASAGHGNTGVAR